MCFNYTKIKIAISTAVIRLHKNNRCIVLSYYTPTNKKEVEQIKNKTMYLKFILYTRIGAKFAELTWAIEGKIKSLMNKIY